MTQIVGFSGRKGSGKDTAAGVFEANGALKIKMADGLKWMIGALLAYQGADEALIERMIEGDLKEVPTAFLHGKSPRYAMQTLGTEWGRNLIGPDFWVGVFARAVDSCGAPLVVCSDVRFPNEVAMIREMGGITYRIEREGHVGVDTHESETQIDTLQVDGVFLNNASSAEAFQHQVVRMLTPSLSRA